jgi:hypothetical protein
MQDSLWVARRDVTLRRLAGVSMWVTSHLTTLRPCRPQGAAAFTTSTNLSLSLSLSGLGPRFRLTLLLRNEGGKQLADVPVALRTEAQLYKLGKTQFVIPFLVPSLQYSFEVRHAPPASRGRQLELRIHPDGYLHVACAGAGDVLGPAGRNRHHHGVALGAGRLARRCATPEGHDQDAHERAGRVVRV